MPFAMWGWLVLVKVAKAVHVGLCVNFWPLSSKQAQLIAAYELEGRLEMLSQEESSCSALPVSQQVRK